MFANGSAEQMASMLTNLLGSVSPGVAQAVGLGASHGAEVTTDQADQVSPEAVQQLVQHAEKHDPSIVDRLSAVYAEHPTLVKTLGTAAMVIAMQKIAERYQS